MSTMNFWTSCGCQMRPIFISHVTWTSRTIVTGQTATLKKFMNALYTAARWRYGVQFPHTGSSDLTFSKMKSGSQDCHLGSVCWDAAIFCCTCNEQFSTTSRSLVSTGWCDIAHCKAINGSCARIVRYRVISRFGDIPWPPRSPDLSVCDFFFVGLP